MRKRNYSDEEFIVAVKTSFSIREVLRKIGVRPTGGNYDVAKRRIIALKLETEHLTGRGHLKGRSHCWAKKTPTLDILVKNSKYGGGSSKIKNRLFKEGLLEEKCSVCGINEWRGQKLALELEHKNGDRFDNQIENLTILCPNCHSLTSTYRGRNMKSSNGSFKE